MKEERDRYIIYKDLNYGVVKLSAGKKSLNEINETLQKFLSDEHLHLIHFMLIDIRGCKFNFKLREMFSLLNLIAKYKHLNNRKRTAYLTDSPLETAFAHFFIRQLKGQRRVCSTLETVYSHLNLNVSFQEFKKISKI